MKPGDLGQDYLEPEPGAAAPKPSGETGEGQEKIMAELFEKPLKESIWMLEHHRLCKALAACRFNQKKAAALLGLTYDQFRGLKRKHDSC